MKTTTTWITFALAALASTHAYADRMAATLGEPLREVSHLVELSAQDGVATYVVRRTFANAGDRHDQVELEIELPPGAAATGLRIRSGKRWYDGELMDASEAETLYRELTGIGPHRPKDPALLAWMWADQLSLSLFPVPPHSTATVEYTLTVPTQYVDGRWHVAYPRKSPNEPYLVPPTFVTDLADVELDGTPIAWGMPTALGPLPDQRECARVEADSSCAVVEFRVDEISSGPVRVKLDIDHTYRGDLRFHLVGPTGAIAELPPQSGSENDVHLHETVTIDARPGRYQLIVSDHAALDTGTVERAEISFGNRTFIGLDLPKFVPDADSDGSFARLSFPAHVRGLADIRYGRVDRLGALIGRVEIDVAARLSKMPDDLHVVFVLDGSYTMGVDGIARQMEAVHSYVHHVPDALVDVVVARRFAEELFAQPIKAAELAANLKHVPPVVLEPGNGSALDAGLSLAHQILENHRGTRRVVAFSDELLRQSFTAANATAHVRQGVHHIVVPAHTSGLQRYDDSPLEPISRATGGITVKLGWDLADKALDESTLYLVRPTQLDHVRLTAGPDQLASPDTLREGAGIRLFDHVDNLPASYRIQAQLWSREVTFVGKRRQRFDRATAAWVFPHDLHADLTDEQMHAIAMFGRAVSPVTSYLAIEPGVRPSTAGLDHGGLGLRGAGSGGAGYGAGGLGLGARHKRLDPFGPVVRQCAQAHARQAGAVSVELTRHEIVDVRGPTNPYADCVVEGIWALALPSSHFRATRDTKVIPI